MVCGNTVRCGIWEGPEEGIRAIVDGVIVVRECGDPPGGCFGRGFGDPAMLFASCNEMSTRVHLPHS